MHVYYAPPGRRPSTRVLRAAIVVFALSLASAIGFVVAP